MAASRVAADHRSLPVLPGRERTESLRSAIPDGVGVQWTSL
ncbi:hypothetical protein AB0I60_14640 [Actinosynnema sp. NPDC050436]